MRQTVKANRLRSALVFGSGAGAAASQAGVLLFLNQGLTGTSTNGESPTTPALAIGFALSLTVIAAWLQFASSRLVIAIWIARRNQNLLRLDNALQQLTAWIPKQTTAQDDREIQQQALQILVSLRSLNMRQGLAVRASFGTATGAMSLTGLLIGAIILNAPITLILVLSSLVVVLPLTLRHGAQMASNERWFRLYSARSSSSFKESVRDRFLQRTVHGSSDFSQEASYLKMNESLMRRLNTPNWNRVIAVTVLVGGLPLLLTLGLVFGYQVPPVGTLVVLLIALLAALTQIASLSGLITVLGRFLDTITAFEEGLSGVAAIQTNRDLSAVTRRLQTMSAGGQETDDV